MPATNDIAWIGTASRAVYRPLLEAGVHIREYRGPMMHAKTNVIDGWFSRVGSTGLNLAGLWTNWELDLVVEDRDFATRMERMFETDLGNADEVLLDAARRVKAPGRATRTRPTRGSRRGLRRPHLLPVSGGSGSLALGAVARAGGSGAQPSFMLSSSSICSRQIRKEAIFHSPFG